MKLRSIMTFAILALAVAMASLPSVMAPSYLLSISPTSTVSLGTVMTMTLILSGGAKSTGYALVFDVVKPNGGGSASTTRGLTTDNRGAASVSVQYPDPSFTAASGTVATDVGGVYNVLVNQTAPTNAGTVTTGQFTVSSQLTVVVSQPTGGSVVQRGQFATISVTVSTLSGPDSSATVLVNTPSSTRIFLTQSGVGVYSVNYLVQASDPTGLWPIVAEASDTGGNSGNSSAVTVTITKNGLIVDSLVAYNAKGVPATSFSPGDTVFAFFRIRYSSGAYLTTGQYPVRIRNPSGVIVANLTAAYDASRFGFYTATGYPISGLAPGGTWTVVVTSNSIDDGYGNTGPGLDTSVPLDVTISVSPLSYWPFVAAGAIAIIAGIVTVKRLDTTLEGFQHLEQLMGGPVPRGASLFLLGDAGSGKTILSYQLLHEELESGKQCALLSYDAFPEDVQARMNEFGWDIVSPLRKGRLRIIDCYSGLAGQGEGAIKDPSDLTEMNIQVTAFIGKARGGPVTVILDSLTPIFNGVEQKQALNFIQTLCAKVKKTGGLLILTASRGAIPEDSVAKIKTMSDGVIELSMTRTHGKAHRFLSVLKMERRTINSNLAPFRIDRTRGLVFRVSRFASIKKKLNNILRRHNIGAAPITVGVAESQPSKLSPTRTR